MFIRWAVFFDLDQIVRPYRITDRSFLDSRFLSQNHWFCLFVDLERCLAFVSCDKMGRPGHNVEWQKEQLLGTWRLNI